MILKWWLKWKKKRRKVNTIEEYLEDKGYVLHDAGGSKKVYFRNMEIVQIIKSEKDRGRVIYDVNGSVLFDLMFLPEVRLFEYLIKNAGSHYAQHNK